MFIDYLKSTKASFNYSFRFAGRLSRIVILLVILLAIIPYAYSYALRLLLNTIATISKDNLVSAQVLLHVLFFSSIVALPKILNVLFSFVNKLWVFKLSEKLEILILRKKLKINIADYENPNFKNLMQRAFYRGYSPLMDLTRYHFKLMELVISFTIGSLIAWYIHPTAYLVLMITIIPGLIVHSKFGVDIWNIRSEDSQEQRRFLDLKRYFNNVNYIMETKLLQSGAKLIGWIQSILRDFYLKHLKFEKKKFLLTLAAEVIYQVGYFISLYLILIHYFDFNWKLGDLVFTIGVFKTAKTSIQDIFIGMTKQYEEHLSVRDILKFLNTPTLEAKGDSSFKLYKAPEIVFENVWFKYPSSTKWVLNGVSFKIDSNKMVALIGPNGSGKSTIVKLLCKIYQPNKGNIYINGYSLEKISNDQWWSYLGIMLQDSMIYNFTAKEAIAIGDISRPQDYQKIVESCTLSTANGFIKKWLNKYETPLGVEFGGEEPSKGQRQKLSLAKILYRGSFLTIFDEPTTSMDVQSIRSIARNLKQIAKGKTLLVVTHDLNITKHCDEILLIENGCIKAFGTHLELLETSFYRNIN